MKIKKILTIIISIFSLSLLFACKNTDKIVKENKTSIEKQENENKNSVKFIEKVKINLNNKIYEINLDESFSKKLNDEIEKIFNSGEDKPYESKYDDSLEFGQFKILFNEEDIKDREKNNKEVQKTMEDDIQTHKDGGFSDEQIEKKFGKENDKIRTTATCAIEINGKDFSIYNDENLINLIFDIYSKINK